MKWTKWTYSAPIWHRLLQLWKQMKLQDSGVKPTGKRHPVFTLRIQSNAPECASSRCPSCAVLKYLYLCFVHHRCSSPDMLIKEHSRGNLREDHDTQPVPVGLWTICQGAENPSAHLEKQIKIIMSGQEINPCGTGGTPPLSSLQPLWSLPAFLSEMRLCSRW